MYRFSFGLSARGIQVIGGRATKVGISKIYPNILRSYESKSQTVWPIAVLDLFFYGYSLQSAAKSRRLSGPNNWLGQKVKIVPTVQH